MTAMEGHPCRVVATSADGKLVLPLLECATAEVARAMLVWLEEQWCFQHVGLSHTQLYDKLKQGMRLCFHWPTLMWLTPCYLPQGVC